MIIRNSIGALRPFLHQEKSLSKWEGLSQTQKKRKNWMLLLNGPYHARLKKKRVKWCLSRKNGTRRAIYSSGVSRRLQCASRGNGTMVSHCEKVRQKTNCFTWGLSCLTRYMECDISNNTPMRYGASLSDGRMLENTSALDDLLVQSTQIWRLSY